MTVLTSHVQRDETYTRRRQRMEALVAELRERTALVARGGGERAVARHRERGKLTAGSGSTGWSTRAAPSSS